MDNHPPDLQAADHERRLLLEAALRRLNPVEAWVIREWYGVSSLVPDAWSRLGVNGRDPEAAQKAGYRPYYHRTYVELSRDCGLSRHRILQVEAAAIGKLRDVLGRYLAPTP